MAEMIHELREMAAGLLRVEAFNDQFRRPNPNGRYPVCKPIVGDAAGRCERCGGNARQHRPCPAVSPELRWGADFVEAPGEQEEK